MLLKPWWAPDPVLRLLSDLIAAELSRLRPGLLGVRRAPDTRPGLSGPGGADLSPDLGGLGLDSLEFLNLVTAVVVQFHLHETGLDDSMMADARLDHWVATILRSRARWDEAISFQTSGSTGRPKCCTHRMAFLEQEIAFFADRLHDRRRVLCAVPSHHIYGFLFSVMLPAALGIPALQLRDALPGSVLRQAQPGDLLIGHPTFFDLATRGPVPVAADVVAVSSTAPCPEPLWRRLVESGFAAIIEVYGASETAGIGERTAPTTPFRLLPQWSRDCGSNTRIARLSAVGEAVLAELPDQVQWVDDDRFHVLGRRDGAVQVGGINVFPRRVERCVREHPEVADALVRLASAEQGGRLKAFVVPGAGCADPQHLPERLHAWLAERLAPAERPRTIIVGAQLPRSSLGKSTDWD
jgi:4-coumarate--CoA ligase (photoactive yellow protein activation family)